MKVWAVVAVLGCMMAGIFGNSAQAQQAEEDTAPVKAACGAMNINFSVTDTATPATPAIPAGKALVYVFEDMQHIPLSTQNFRVGVNGNWVGALKDKVYLSFLVDPGVQHLCTSVQGRAFYQLQKGITLRQLRPEAGKTYYLRLRETLGKDTLPLILLEPVDEDEGSLLLQTMRQAVWQKK